MHNSCAMKNVRYMSYMSTWLKKIRTNAVNRMMIYTVKANLRKYYQLYILLTNGVSKNKHDQRLKKLAAENRLA